MMLMCRQVSGLNKWMIVEMVLLVLTACSACSPVVRQESQKQVVHEVKCSEGMVLSSSGVCVQSANVTLARRHA